MHYIYKIKTLNNSRIALINKIPTTSNNRNTTAQKNSRNSFYIYLLVWPGLLHGSWMQLWKESRIPGFKYEKHFGGVIYLFLRGIRDGSNTGIYTAMPPKDVIDRLDEAFYGESGPQIIH